MKPNSPPPRMPASKKPAVKDDQASGLRELVASRPNQVIAFAGGTRRCGRTTLVLEAAMALARSGLKVIIVDENDSDTNMHAVLGRFPAGDLLNALLIKTPLAELVAAIEPNLWLAHAAKAAALLRFDSPKGVEIATTLIDPMEAAANFVLIDSLYLEGGHLSLLSARAHHMVIVVSAEAEAIQGAYAVIKRLAAERGREGFYLAITGADSDAAAKAIYNNLKKTAQRYLGVRVDFLVNLTYPLAQGIDKILLGRLPMVGSREQGIQADKQ